MTKTQTEQRADDWIVQPSKLSWKKWWGALKRTIIEMGEMDVSLRSAGVAFFGFLSLFPAIAAGVAIFALVADPTTLNSQLTIMNDFLPSQVINLITERLESLSGSTQSLGIGLAISVVLALWSGSRGMNSLIYALSKAHLEDRDRSFVQNILVSLTFTIGGFFVTFFIFTAVAVIPAVTLLLPFPQHAETIALWLRWPVVLVVVFGAIVILYKKAPHRSDPKFRWVVPGATLATILWLIGSMAFSFYIENFSSYDATFGSIATAAVLMLWLNFSANVFILGAMLNANLELQREADSTIGSVKPRGERGAVVADKTISEI